MSEPQPLAGVTRAVNVTNWSLSEGCGVYIGFITFGSLNVPFPSCVHSTEPSYRIFDIIFIGPSQTILSGPRLIVGFLTILITILSVAGVLQGLFPEALKVNVTEPFEISFGPGIYVGVKEFGPTIVPSPVPFVHNIVLFTTFWAAIALNGTI